jgi:hypothetical protein
MLLRRLSLLGLLLLSRLSNEAAQGTSVLGGSMSVVADYNSYFQCAGERSKRLICRTSPFKMALSKCRERVGARN